MKKVMDGLDVSHLKASLAAHRDEFMKELMREKHPDTAQLDSPSVYLRMVPFPIQSFHDFITNRRVINWSAAQLVPNFLAAIVDLNKLLEGRLARASIVWVRPGASVLAHPTTGAYAADVDRYHLVINHLPGDPMKAGELWQVTGEPLDLPNADPAARRLHLICDQWKMAPGILPNAQTLESPSAHPQEAHSMTPPAPQSTAAAPRGKGRKKPNG